MFFGHQYDRCSFVLVTNLVTMASCENDPLCKLPPRRSSFPVISNPAVKQYSPCTDQTVFLWKSSAGHKTLLCVFQSVKLSPQFLQSQVSFERTALHETTPYMAWGGTWLFLDVLEKCWQAMGSTGFLQLKRFCQMSHL